jgi:hypothetical protein
MIGGKTMMVCCKQLSDSRTRLLTEKNTPHPLSDESYNAIQCQQDAANREEVELTMGSELNPQIRC